MSIKFLFTPLYILNALMYQYKTSTRPFVIFFLVFMSGVNVSPHFRKELRYVAYFFNEIIYFRFTECVWLKYSLSADAGSVVGGVTLEEEQIRCLLFKAST